MNFKRFNGSTWETVQHKIYGSGTDSLTAFPAVIQASGEALTDYTISGNTVQDGTPTPEAPVDVVGCGVWDATAQQYKPPITVNGTEHPIYLGQVETTRRIKKLVLDGAENLVIYSGFGAQNCFQFNTNIIDHDANFKAISTHFVYTSVLRTLIDNDGTFMFDSGHYIRVHISSCATIEDLKSYLASQYAAGTPVCVWYVLAEPETGIVNEPLHKIGDYADTISFAQAGVTIPTSDGENTISFGTSVQPSAMSATFKGWHPVQAAKVYDGNDWS